MTTGQPLTGLQGASGEFMDSHDRHDRRLVMPEENIMAEFIEKYPDLLSASIKSQRSPSTIQSWGAHKDNILQLKARHLTL